MAAPSPDLLSRAAALLGAEASRWQRAGITLLDSAAYGRPVSTPTPPTGSLGGFAPSLPPEKLDELRRLGASFLETLLASLTTSPHGSASTAEQRVPLIQCLAPVQAGETARASLRISNEENTPSEVMLYASNFVADSGYELPSTLVSAVPRVALLQPHTEATFEIEIVIPKQAARGSYSGLVQALGHGYVKAVITLEVL